GALLDRTGIQRAAEAAMVEGDAGIAVAEERHLLEPGQVVAARTVREDDRRSGAVRLVVQVGSARGQERHGIPLQCGVRNRFHACVAAHWAWYAPARMSYSSASCYSSAPRSRPVRAISSSWYSNQTVW